MKAKKNPFELGAEMGADILAELDTLEQGGVGGAEDIKDSVLGDWKNSRSKLGAAFAMEIGTLEEQENIEPNSEEGLTAGRKIKLIKKLRADIFEIIDRPEFDEYRKKTPKKAERKRGLSNAQRLTKYSRVILMNSKKILNDKKSIDELDEVEFEAMKSLLELSQKAPTMQAILKKIEKNKKEEIKKSQEARALDEQEALQLEEERLKAEAEAKKNEEVARLKTEKEEKIKKINDEIEREKKEIEVANVAMGKRKGKVNNKILNTIKLRLEKIEKLEFDRDMLEAEDVDSIGEVKGKKATLKKLRKKSQKATSVDKGGQFEGLLEKDNINNGEQIFMESGSRTSRVASIKKCKDGSYIIETETSYYRLNIEEENDENKKESLTPEEQREVIKFFDKDVLPTYRAKREENNWTGYSDDVAEFLRVQFEETAKAFNFLDGDESKIKEAWNLIAGSVQEKVNALEAEIKKESEPKTSAKKESFTLEQITEKLKAAGASDEDMKYFFNLQKKDREEFLLSTDEKLAFRIEKLREKREANENIISEAEKLETNEKLKRFGEYMKAMRSTYLNKEYEFNKTTSKMKRFFRMEKVDMGNAQEELESSKKDYQEAVKNYLNLMVQIEKPGDAEERKIIYRYAQIGEALQVMDAKEDIKFAHHPNFEATKRDFEVGALSFIDKYKELLGKPRELLQNKTKSKTLGFGGGMIAVGGAMAFAANYIPGLSGIARTLSVAIATKGFYERAENKAIIEKEESLEKGAEELEKRLEYINDLGANVDEAFRRELGLAVDNILEEVKKEKEAVGKRMALSLAKAIAVSTIFYEAGQAVGVFFKGMPGTDQSASEENIKQLFKNENSFNGLNIHTQTNFPPVNSDSNIVEDFNSAELPKPLVEEANTNSTNVPETPSTFEQESSLEQKTSSNQEDSPTQEKVQTSEYSGIELDESGQGSIEIIEGKGIKDTVAALLAKNYENLTEGKMGWNPDKYASVDEWAHKRAIGIVGESEYNINKVSLESQITLDMSNPADIKIVDFVDGQDLESGASNKVQTENIKTVSNEFQSAKDEIETSANPEIKTEEIANIEKMNQNVEDIRNEILSGETADQETVETVKDIRENVAKLETQAAHRIGINPKHYAEINHMSTAEFIAEAKRVDSIVHGGGEDSMDVATSNLPVGTVFGNDEMANSRMGRVLNYLVRDGKIENPNQSIAETLRSVNESDFMGAIRTYEGTFGAISEKGDLAMSLDENEMYSEYMSALIQSELKDMIGNNAGEGKIMKELAALRGVSMGSLSDNELLMSFKEATKNSVGNVVYKDSETVGKYILTSIRRACEIGEIDKLKENISKIDISNLQKAA